MARNIENRTKSPAKKTLKVKNYPGLDGPVVLEKVGEKEVSVKGMKAFIVEKWGIKPDASDQSDQVEEA